MKPWDLSSPSISHHSGNTVAGAENINRPQGGETPHTT
jgi:hypothetical protein